MANNLHTRFLKYGAIFGLVPFKTPVGQQKHHYQKQKFTNAHQQLFHHYHLHYLRYNSTNNNNTSNNNHNRPLRWQQIYTVTLIVANLITTLYGVIFLPFGDNFIVSNLVSIIVFFVQIVTVISILLETMLKYDKYYELMDNYSRVEILMKQLLQMQLCKTTICKRQKKKYSIVILTVFGSLLASIIVIGVKTYTGYFWYALIAIMILRSRSIQMSLYLDYFVYYLEAFNIKLRALISCKIDKNYHILDIDYDHLESFVYLQNLKAIYMEIYMLHDKFNELYGHSLASILTVVVLDIIINVYWTFLTIFEYYATYYIYITFSTLVPLFVILFTLCNTGEQCEKQCNLILISLKRLSRTSLSSSINAECYNSLLQSFIMQILQNPIQIRANGYFTVNLKSLMKILANIATYLIILLQFRKANVNDEMPKIPTTFSNSSEGMMNNISKKSSVVDF